MKSFRIILTCSLLLLLTSPAQARTDDEFPIRVQKLSNRVIVLSTMTGNCTTVAIAAEKGLVMIDSMWSPSIAAEVREIIEREFGRDDFAYCINTSENIFRSGGNQVFSDAIIIAHEKSREALRRLEENLPELLQRRALEFDGRVERTKKQLENLDQGSDQAKFNRDWIIYCQRVAADFYKGYKITLPTVTFTDQMTLELGDLTMELIYFGKTRYEGNIAVKVPEEGLLMLGDLFHSMHVLPMTNRDPDISRWLEVLD